MADHPESGDTDAPEDATDPTAVDSNGSDPVSADAASDATTTDGGTTQTGLPADEEQSTPSTVDDGLVGDGPESDQEMPLADHIEEMMRRLGIVFLVAGIVTVAVYPFAGETINFLWSSHIPEAAANRPRLYGPWSSS